MMNAKYKLLFIVVSDNAAKKDSCNLQYGLIS